eukprot:15454829-Alexandrium_andersonii.AAC.1
MLVVVLVWVLWTSGRARDRSSTCGRLGFRRRCLSECCARSPAPCVNSPASRRGGPVDGLVD